MEKYRNGFEAFLVYITIVSSSFSFLIMAPMVVERSLSCFIYFYAVENTSITSNSVSDKFISLFVQKRFKDGIRGGFLTEKNGMYYPTLKAKFFYSLYYPLGYFTNTLKNYQEFKKLSKEYNKDK